MNPAAETRGCWASTPAQCRNNANATTNAPRTSMRRGAAAISRRRIHRAARLASGKTMQYA